MTRAGQNESPITEMLSLMREQREASFHLNQQLESLATTSAQSREDLEDLKKEVS